MYCIGTHAMKKMRHDSNLPRVHISAWKYPFSRKMYNSSHVCDNNVYDVLIIISFMSLHYSLCV